ncbi:MAG: Kynureninase [Fimbriimonadaceae bacterium]|nr:Kynureninase [Fimbriimonadaceae bacterium]
MTSRAAELDRLDPLAWVRGEFIIEEGGPIYLDGNSLGRCPRAALEILRKAAEADWANGLVRSWSSWFDLPARLGSEIGRLIGAAGDSTRVSDSTSVNLYKLASAALRRNPARNRIVTDDLNFPSDVYVLREVAERAGGLLTIVPSDGIHGPVEGINEAMGEDVGVLSLSLVAYRSGYLYDGSRLGKMAKSFGSLMLWDLSHAVGAVPIDLGEWDADMAVGCSYKYLNGGPGAPAFLYVRPDLAETLAAPIPGWFGHAEAFGFSLDYTPGQGIERFTVSTPPVLSMAAMEPGLALLNRVGVEAVREKSISQTAFMMECWTGELESLGFGILTPTDPARRGAHVTLSHEHALAIDLALIEEEGVIPDFRGPNGLRLGFSPLYTTFSEIEEAARRIRRVVESRRYEKYRSVRPRVT